MFSLTVCDHIMIVHGVRGEAFGATSGAHAEALTGLKPPPRESPVARAEYEGPI